MNLLQLFRVSVSEHTNTRENKEHRFIFYLLSLFLKPRRQSGWTITMIIRYLSATRRAEQHVSHPRWWQHASCSSGAPLHGEAELWSTLRLPGNLLHSRPNWLIQPSINSAVYVLESDPVSSLLNFPSRVFSLAHSDLKIYSLVIRSDQTKLFIWQINKRKTFIILEFCPRHIV